MYREKLKIDIQGHRGCRGLFPENSIPAFLKAIELGVDTLEFDAVISKDKKVIISHEPFMSHSICLMPDGSEISQKEELKQNIYNLNYQEIKAYDCGSKYFSRFPNQEKLSTHKPSLVDVVLEAEKANPDILYNLEIKRKIKWDNSHHPTYQEFADIVIAEVINLGIESKTTIQCFDVETLQYIHISYPSISLVYLIENIDSPVENIVKLGFIPSIYSPDFTLVDPLLVKYCENLNMKLIPWTVNETNDIQKMLSFGVDGIISDYPDRVLQICQNPIL